ncbi:MAG: hypothetical protein ACOVS5_10835 [Oligoflexus sp.]|jgi:hypothetical protein
MKRNILLLLSMLSTSSVWARNNPMPRLATSEAFIPLTIGEGGEELRVNERSYHPYPGYNQDAHRYYNRQLRDRIRTLEIAVRQLQEEVIRLRLQRDNDPNLRKNSYTCFIPTPFDGSFYGKGETKLEAKAKALNECEKKNRSFCQESKVVCEKAD